jgi:AcrR family transcriptional regulator
MPKKITQIGVEARRAAAVEAASVVFLRYGYARTTMAELAAAANLSRPTLYELFSNKDDLFTAVINHLSQQTIQRYRDLQPKLRTLRTKLHHFCGDWATHGLRLIERHPDAKDLFDLRFPPVRQMYEDFIRFLVEVILDEDRSISLPTEKVARNLVFSLRGLKDAASDVKHMEELVRLQVDVFLTTLAPRE